MKIISIGFKNPLGLNPVNINLKDLDWINFFIGKNNSGKTTLLNELFRNLNPEANRDTKLTVYKVKLIGSEFKNIFHNFYEQFSKTPRWKISNPMADFVPHLTDTFVNLKKILDNEETAKNLVELEYIFNFNKDTKGEITLQMNLLVENSSEIDNEILKNFINDLQAFPGLLEEKEILYLLNQVLPIEGVILIPSLRQLESSNLDFDKDQSIEADNILKTLLNNGFRSLHQHTKKPYNPEIFIIPNLSLILNRIQQIKYEIDPQFVHDFIENLSKLFPNIKLRFDYEEFMSKVKYMEFDMLFDNLNMLGSGAQQLISLLFLFCFPRDAIYLIDEPENGLHPGLQHFLLKIIKEQVINKTNYNKQFFFATHSTCFIDFRGKCSHYICKKDKEGFFVDPIEKNNLAFLRDELGLTPSALLQANGIIWVEGISDIPYIQVLFRCFGISLEDHNVVVRSYYGKDNVLSGSLSIEILKSYNPNFVIIMDSDKKSVKEQPPGKVINKQKEFEQAGYKFWIFEEFCDIEGILPQEALNKFFNINTHIQEFKLKDKYEKLDLYIRELKKLDVVDKNSPKYEKVRDSYKISSLIQNNETYMNIIKNNLYLNREVKDIYEIIKVWENLLTFENNIQEYDELIQEYKNGYANERKFILQKFQRKKEEIIYHLVNSLNSELVNDKKVYQEILNELDPNWLELFKNMVILDDKKSKPFDSLKSFIDELIANLKLYKNKMDDASEEPILVENLGKLFDNNHGLIENLDFRIDHNGDSILNNDFWIHLTRKPRSKNIFQFLVRKLNNGQSFKPDIVFLSKKYPNTTKDNINTGLQVLNEFIEYLETFTGSQPYFEDIPVKNLSEKYNEFLIIWRKVEINLRNYALTESLIPLIDKPYTINKILDRLFKNGSIPKGLGMEIAHMLKIRNGIVHGIKEFKIEEVDENIKKLNELHEYLIQILNR